MLSCSPRDPESHQFGSTLYLQVDSVVVQFFSRQVATAGSTVCAALDQIVLVAGYWVQDWNGERPRQKKDAEEEKREEQVQRRCSGGKDKHWACFFTACKQQSWCSCCHFPPTWLSVLLKMVDVSSPKPLGCFFTCCVYCRTAGFFLSLVSWGQFASKVTKYWRGTQGV